MWLYFLMDDCHFSNITKVIINFVPIHIWENKNIYNFFKNGHIYTMEITFLKN